MVVYKITFVFFELSVEKHIICILILNELCKNYWFERSDGTMSVVLQTLLVKISKVIVTTTPMMSFLSPHSFTILLYVINNLTFGLERALCGDWH